VKWYCVGGKCRRKALDGYWLCARCAKQNGGDALEVKAGQWPSPDVFLLGSRAKK
jgi:hypothetical protein